MKSRAKKSDAVYLEKEDYWSDDFSIVWHQGTKAFRVVNQHTGKITTTRCMVKAFKIAYLAKQWLDQLKPDDAAPDLLEQVAELLGITILQINQRLVAIN